MPEKDQIYIFNSEELSLIKNTFAENEPLLHAVRKVLLQFPLSDSDKALVDSLSPAVIAVIKKRILPELSPVFPLGQLPSLMTTLTQDIKVKDVEEMALQFASKQLQYDYLEQQFSSLEGKGEGSISLAKLGTLKGKDTTTQFIDMSTYLFLLGYIDPMLIALKVIAGTKDETVEKQKERMGKNSNK